MRACVDKLLFPLWSDVLKFKFKFKCERYMYSRTRATQLLLLPVQNPQVGKFCVAVREVPEDLLKAL